MHAIISSLQMIYRLVLVCETDERFKLSHNNNGVKAGLTCKNQMMLHML